ncbi:ras association domain-containing protein 10-like [Saccoglossus kowalevskii]|uniref:Ras association domain-containing protein 10-like isoform X1 n=1 Tax=Saccoglossus kowalevskii TaxID=10224 RepID=A0ABM0MJG5_SACKO|nr:PREDICTED: ras association domain-containing protein 10-like isoform X1 [Saccoglossus kowalevskii]XP_006820156.1 PREDICTED: ras association domain-containing protein 10-like isoform X2 [Saccoglossus kowalevskii]
MGEIAVWIDGREKRVAGMTKKTTCGEVVKTLLRVKNKDLNDEQHCLNFTLFERWRDCERPLPAKTKIYKVWKAWGNEQENVKFTLKKYKSSKSGSDNGRSYRPNNDKRERCGDENRNKISRSKHRNSQHRGEDGDDPESKHVLETLESLIQVVIAQDQRIQELLERIEDTDEEIEYYETRIHIERLKENGKNYVQDSYLTDADDADSAMGGENIESYISACENLLRLDQDIENNETTIERLTQQLEEESLSLSSFNENNNSCEASTLNPESEVDMAVILELNKLRQELEKSVRTGLQQRGQLCKIKQENVNSDTALENKRKQIECLALELQLLNTTDEHHNTDNIDVTIDDIIENTDILTKDVNYSSKDAYDNESDADTGLSSLHSQDDDSPTVVETLV